MQFALKYYGLQIISYRTFAYILVHTIESIELNNRDIIKFLNYDINRRMTYSVYLLYKPFYIVEFFFKRKIFYEAVTGCHAYIQGQCLCIPSSYYDKILESMIRLDQNIQRGASETNLSASLLIYTYTFSLSPLNMNLYRDNVLDNFTSHNS